MELQILRDIAPLSDTQPWYVLKVLVNLSLNVLKTEKGSYWTKKSVYMTVKNTNLH